VTIAQDSAAAARVGSIMAAARALTVGETQDLSTFTAGGATVALPTVTMDPLDDLVARLRPTVATAVDALQVAAVLEAEGISDRSARVEYGFADVFRLAEEVFGRLGPHRMIGAPKRRGPRPPVSAPREIFHGALYLLPTAVFPAMLALVGRASLVTGLVLAGGTAWIMAGAASWAAYRLLGAGHPAGADRVLRWSAFGGLPVAAALGAGVVAVTGGGYVTVVLAVGQMAYQMASTLLMFYRRELWLLPVMAPAVVTGAGYLVAGPVLLPVTVGTGVASVVLAFALGIAETVGTDRSDPADPGGRAGPAGPAGRGGEPAPHLALGEDLPTLPWVAAYAALSAMYLLHAHTPYLLGRLDIALAAAPLIVGMGVVEWRARRFGELARALPARVRLPAEFGAAVWRYLLGGLGCCTGVVALLAVGMLVAVGLWRSVSPAGVVMTAAYAVLAGAYFLGFLLAERARYGWLCGALAVATALHLTARMFVAGPSGPLVDAVWYLGSAALLQVLFLAGLAPIVGQVWRYR
jgi:hypothetical protein